MFASHALASQSAANADYWQVRASGSGHARFVESTSVINRHRPRAAGKAVTSPLRSRQRGALVVDLHADPQVAAALQAANTNVDIELDTALDWLERLPAASTPGSRIAVHLVDTRWQRRLRLRHPRNAATVVEILVPIEVPIEATPDAAKLTVQIGKALATGLHEMAHALDAGSGRSRADDEYRASLVGTCYLLDTLRPGDVLTLADADAGGSGESFISSHSRAAATRVNRDLARVGNGRRIGWQQRDAMRRMQQFCRTRLVGTDL